MVFAQTLQALYTTYHRSTGLWAVSACLYIVYFCATFDETQNLHVLAVDGYGGQSCQIWYRDQVFIGKTNGSSWRKSQPQPLIQPHSYLVSVDKKKWSNLLCVNVVDGAHVPELGHGTLELKIQTSHASL